MKLKELYSLRKNFTVIGLTGRVGAGCSDIAKFLANEDFTEKVREDLSVHHDSLIPENLKYKICSSYLSYGDNFKPFHIINYRDVLLLHLLYYGSNDSDNIGIAIGEILKIIFQNGKNGDINKTLSARGEDNCYTNRFDNEEDIRFKDNIKSFLVSEPSWYELLKDNNKKGLNIFLKDNRQNASIFEFYFEFFENFSNKFYQLLNQYNLTKRTRLFHDLANNLREFGTVENLQIDSDARKNNLDNIYIVAETINQLIKIWRNNKGEAKIIIDSLKNSLELMFFKEKFAAFYMVAANKSLEERKVYIRDQISHNYKFDNESVETYLKEILELGDGEYDGGDVNKGEFYAPDVENCIQKSDFHIYFSDSKKGIKEVEDSKSQYDYLSLVRQLTKLVALIHQPGIITPTNIERCMQVAYNAKFNSGCISRQVGAVITDENFVVKSIGWNDVAQHQIPCNLRSVTDLISNDPSELFSDYEKSDEKELELNKNIFESFKGQMTKDYSELKEKDDQLEGRNCSFCFKTSINAYEGEKNQVHTRSLHAEENAMMQLVKYGSEGVKGGNLFTTASPCELCSKKAFQLGIKNIYYIDPYPGIAGKHILKSGIDPKNNPKVLMFQGAVGRAFHKLYEPFIAYKDELKILTGISPTQKQK